ncbi:MAG: hypothetical protein R2709_06305 [Marmoricola sp.]
MDDSAPEARLATLLEGNRRFASGAAQGPNRDHVRRVRISEEQNPHALVLCCSDSREVPELIFDCGFGETFSWCALLDTVLEQRCWPAWSSAY